MARRARKGSGRRRSSGSHVYHFALFSLLIFTITLLGTIGLSITGMGAGYQREAPYSLDSFQMIALMWILALAFLIPTELMIRNSRA
ncbi:MAG: hypothetical protein HYW25_03965 [Candidatus Aenigmarchaeota archaeon]|nr:hypothetical protein [Candidatus Aenigmarchaeota archaeon]